MVDPDGRVFGYDNVPIYDASGRLLSGRGVDYEYDATGRRTAARWADQMIFEGLRP